ncbi:hypothetical protein JXA32_07705 [Candidatus Sumerlaeota bacterium]|nr:hypothetical protein [Candidatus Sumerlaeota bacterium]
MTKRKIWMLNGMLAASCFLATSGWSQGFTPLFDQQPPAPPAFGAPAPGGNAFNLGTPGGVGVSDTYTESLGGYTVSITPSYGNGFANQLVLDNRPTFQWEAGGVTVQIATNRLRVANMDYGQVSPGSDITVNNGQVSVNNEPRLGREDWRAMLSTRKTVLTGARVQDRITHKLLDDVYYIRVTDDEFNQMVPLPSDDGEWPDLTANDKIYSNFDQTDKYLSPESNQLKLRVIRMIELAENLGPLDFYGVHAAATDPFSTLPNYYVEEENRDKKIREWVDQFLKDYRREPDNPDSTDFWPLYVPEPPRKPYMAAPESFDALYLDRSEESQQEMTEAQQQGPQGRTVIGPSGQPIPTTGDTLISGPGGTVTTSYYSR